MSDIEDVDGPTEEPTSNIRAADGTIRPVRPDEAPLVAQAWDGNVQAVQDARAALREARLHAAETEDRVAGQARKRDPRRPVLNAAEHAELEAARADVGRAAMTSADAGRRFKAGVTADQIEQARQKAAAPEEPTPPGKSRPGRDIEETG